MRAMPLCADSASTEIVRIRGVVCEISDFLGASLPPCQSGSEASFGQRIAGRRLINMQREGDVSRSS